ncbi:MAG: tetratricopeptide repeat protein [Parcubacteria group bacterium]|nr:tetratricopeptide repeat protein [Parcubacteria group bacterium]
MNRKKISLSFIIILLFSSLVISFLVKNYTEWKGEKIINDIESQSESNIEIGRNSIDLTDSLTDADLYNAKGNEYLMDKEFQKAIEEFDKAIEINKNYAEPYNGKGVAYRNLGEFNKAIKDYTKAIELYPSFFEAYNNRGVCFMLLNEYDKMCYDFKRACELGSCQKIELSKQKSLCE